MIQRISHRGLFDIRCRRMLWRKPMLHHLLGLIMLLCTGGAAYAEPLPLDRIQLPPGFRIELLARVPNARQMALGDKNVLFIGSASAGKVHALELDPAYRAGQLHVIASGLLLPIGVAYRQGSLYVSAVDRILKFDDVESRLADPPKPVIVHADLPEETHHGGRYIGFGPDGWLYAGIGAPCNICEPEVNRHALIVRMKPDGTQREVFARGIRNTVGFDWHPDGKELWFTDNGRDLLGNDAPPDELNRAPQANLHFGYPYCHGGTVADPKYGKTRSCTEFAPPAQNLGPHVAALGMRFYTGRQFPAAYRKQIFIAEHGSWNRSQKIGYRISLVTLDGNKAVSYKPFATGWLQGEAVWGRPADLLVLPDGSLLVSDDHADAIYRIRYVAP